jgi:excisionase family DNA binding protein
MSEAEVIRYAVEQAIDACLKERGIRAKTISKKVTLNYAITKMGVGKHRLEQAIENGFVRAEKVGSRWEVYREDVERYFNKE